MSGLERSLRFSSTEEACTQCRLHAWSLREVLILLNGSEAQNHKCRKNTALVLCPSCLPPMRKDEEDLQLVRAQVPWPRQGLVLTDTCCFKSLRPSREPGPSGRSEAGSSSASLLRAHQALLPGQRPEGLCLLASVISRQLLWLCLLPGVSRC